MNDIRLLWKESIARALTATAPAGAEPITAEQVTMEIPPDPAFGDIGFPMFAFAKLFRAAPPKIAADVLQQFTEKAKLQPSAPISTYSY